MIRTVTISENMANRLPNSHILMACVITEVPPPTEYLQFRTRSSEATESVSHVSLMYCPLLPSKDGDTSPTLMNDDPRGRLQRLILHLRQFTTSFLSSRSRVCQEQEQLYDAILQSHAFDTSSSSPHIVWVYESCRIAGVVFAAAIRYQVPFSTAVPLAVKDSGNASLLDDLYHAIYRSPYSSRPFWGEWAGAFLWVSLVSASISLCGSEGELWPHDKLYREMKLRRTSLAFPFVFATKLFHIKETSRQAFMITETMIRIQEKLAASSGI